MHLKNIVVGGVSSSPPTLIVYRYDRTRIDRIEREKQGKKSQLEKYERKGGKSIVCGGAKVVPRVRGREVSGHVPLPFRTKRPVFVARRDS